MTIFARFMALRLHVSRTRFNINSQKSQCYKRNVEHASDNYRVIYALITVFDAILTGRQSFQKLQCLNENPIANNFFSKLNSSQFVNQNVKILGRRLSIHLPGKLFPRTASRRLSTQPNLQTNVWKI